MNFIKLFIIILLGYFSVNLYAQEEVMTIVGDSLIGKMINGETVREVYGDVVMRQGNVVVNCDKAIQYISRNDAELIGNVVAKQDSLTIKTPRAFYYGNEKKSESHDGLILNDKKVILTADSGVYFFDNHKAVFNSNVTLYDTASTLTSNELTYFKDEDKAIAVDNVKIIDSVNVINADSLTYFRDNRIAIADNHVQISNENNNSTIYGNHLEDYAKQSYSKMTKSPLLMQIDTTYITRLDTTVFGNIDTILTFRLDTLLISAMEMEAFRDTVNIFRAIDSVEIVRGQFASKNDYTIYYRKAGEIETDKLDKNSPQPIIWYENSQLTGDSVKIFLEKNRIRKLDVNKNAFILSQNKTYSERFDQTSGEKIIIYFENSRITRTKIYGGVHSIYYLFEGDTPNGLTKSSSESAEINFEDNKVSIVKLYGTPSSEYYPENTVIGKELSFTLPGYVLYSNRPTKKSLLRKINIELE